MTGRSATSATAASGSWCAPAAAWTAPGFLFAREAMRRWRRFLTRRMSWSSLPAKREGLCHLGSARRHVAGDRPPGPRQHSRPASSSWMPPSPPVDRRHDRCEDTAETSLLVSMREVLAPYFTDRFRHRPESDRSLVRLPLPTPLPGTRQPRAKIPKESTTSRTYGKIETAAFQSRFPVAGPFLHTYHTLRFPPGVARDDPWPVRAGGEERS